MKRAALRVATSCIGLAAASPAWSAICNVQSNGVAFGAYDALSPGPLDGAGSVRVDCDTETSFTVALGTGSGSQEQRTMTDGQSILLYNLYTEGSRSIVWGDGAGTDLVSATGTGVDLTVFGRIPGRQNIPAGTYVDTITVTISY